MVTPFHQAITAHVEQGSGVFLALQHLHPDVGIYCHPFCSNMAKVD